MDDGSVPVMEDIAKSQHGTVLCMEVPGMLGILHSGSPVKGLLRALEEEELPLAYVQNMDSHNSLLTSPGPCTLAAGPETCLPLPTKLTTSLLDILVMGPAASGAAPHSPDLELIPQKTPTPVCTHL